MADINQIISLGIGTPADIPHFILVGLSIEGSAPIDPTPDWIVRAAADDLRVLIPPDPEIDLPADSGVLL